MKKCNLNNFYDKFIITSLSAHLQHDKLETTMKNYCTVLKE